MPRNLLNYLLLILNLALMVALIYIFKFGNISRATDIDRISYLDLSLSILNAMIALVAIFLAVAGLWGYAAIRESAERKAEEAAKEKAEYVADRVAREVVQAYSIIGNGDERSRSDFSEQTIHEQIQNAIIREMPGVWRKPIRRPTARHREGDDL